ncbi:MAG: glycosyltransferase family 4 protein [Chloroflexi bacterium]|nr:glycosyltransferase family 4 protein [Chloroflexota bacterium]
MSSSDSQQLRILIASGTFHPDSGGPPTYLLALGRELLARGHRVRVITYGDGACPGRRYPYPVTRVPRQRGVPSRLALFGREVWRQGRDVDLLFVNDYGLPAMAANLALRKPLVMKIVGDFAWEYSVRHGLVPPDEPIERFQARRHGPRVEALRLMQATYTRRASRIIVPSRYVARYVVGWGVPSERVRVVYNAVAGSTAPPGESSDRIRERLGVPSGSRVVLTVARLTPWKGIDTLLRAFRAVWERIPNTLLVVVGDGPDRPRLEQLASVLPPGAVRFVGERPHEEVARWLSVAEVLALLSGYEGLSHVLLEATAADVPVVASNVGGNVELIRDGENGLLVPYGDVQATRDALVRLLGDRPLAMRLAAEARREAKDRTLGRLVDATLTVFREALGGEPGARPSPDSRARRDGAARGVDR